MTSLFETFGAPEESPSPPRSSRPRPQLRLSTVIVEILLVTAALVGLYGVWQVFWTDVQAGVTQQAAREELIESWQEPTEPDPTEPAMDPRAFALLHVPRWGEDYAMPIAHGDDAETLETIGIGQYPGTAAPGEIGNFAISAHRTSYGKPFRGVGDLQDGDRLEVETATAVFVYAVVDRAIVSPHDSHVIDPLPPIEAAVEGGRYITLTTCHPLFGTAERFIVWGELVQTLPKEN